MRYTVAVPQQHQEKANQLAMALGLSLNDGRTYSELKYEDSEGNLYSVASFIASQTLADKVGQALERPLWDENEDIDTVQAEQAKSLLAFNTIAGTYGISVIKGIDGLSAIDLMGLTRYNQESELTAEVEL